MFDFVTGFLYDLSGNYSLAFFVSGGTSATAACLIFLVQFFKSQSDIKLGRSKYKEGILDGEWIGQNTDSKQSNSVAASITKPSTRDQSLESLGQVDVLIGPKKATEHVRLNKSYNDEISILQTTKFHQNLSLNKHSEDFSNLNVKSVLDRTVVLADGSEFDELLKRETDI